MVLVGLTADEAETQPNYPAVGASATQR